MPRNPLDEVRFSIIHGQFDKAQVVVRDTAPTLHDFQEFNYRLCYLYSNPFYPEGWRHDGFDSAWDCKSHWSYPLSGRLRRKIDRMALDEERELHRWATQSAEDEDAMPNPTFIEYFLKLNNQGEPVSQKRVRRAVNFMKTQLTGSKAASSTQVTLPRAMLPPLMTGLNPSVRVVGSDYSAQSAATQIWSGASTLQQLVATRCGLGGSSGSDNGSSAPHSPATTARPPAASPHRTQPHAAIPPRSTHSPPTPAQPGYSPARAQRAPSEAPLSRAGLPGLLPSSSPDPFLQPQLPQQDKAMCLPEMILDMTDVEEDILALVPAIESNAEARSAVWAGLLHLVGVKSVQAVHMPMMPVLSKAGNCKPFVICVFLAIRMAITYKPALFPYGCGGKAKSWAALTVGQSLQLCGCVHCHALRVPCNTAPGQTSMCTFVALCCATIHSLAVLDRHAATLMRVGAGVLQGVWDILLRLHPSSLIVRESLHTTLDVWRTSVLKYRVPIVLLHHILCSVSIVASSPVLSVRDTESTMWARHNLLSLPDRTVDQLVSTTKQVLKEERVVPPDLPPVTSPAQLSAVVSGSRLYTTHTRRPHEAPAHSDPSTHTKRARFDSVKSEATCTGSSSRSSPELQRQC
mmetsp:Transcript_27154/g.68193  ORF Transcript_27154/g.68193 Transcript_27154/m.68193 type:complete len:631 (+) Transcript_27154:184-2076(+)